MRYGMGIANKLVALKAATDGAYRFIMLGMMVVEIGLLVTLVVLEALHR